MKNIRYGHLVPVVCIDAGHYGKANQSPAVPEYYESDMTWKLHIFLKAALERYGIQVTMTRQSQDKDLYVTDRGKASEGADLFLSLHSNAVGSAVNEDVDYVAVYHLTEDAGTDVDDRSKELAGQLAPVIAACMGVKQGGKTVTRLAASDKNGDGMLNDNYYGVLNGARQVGTPGLILEHSFHTNTRATQWLMDEGNLYELAIREAEVIAAWFGLGLDTERYRVIIEGLTVGTAETLAEQATASGWPARVELMESQPAQEDKLAQTAPAPETQSKDTSSVLVPDVAKYKDKSKAGSYKVSSNTLNLRTGAGTGNAIITQLKQGAVVYNYGYYNVESDGDIWLCVQTTDGYVGYCHEDYLTKI